MNTADKTITAFTSELAARQLHPGGGAAAAIAAATGAAAGAMAARYTTGKKWADVSEQATALADKLEQAALRFHELADADASAYADLQRTWKEKLPAEEVNAIETRARQVPLDVLNLCADCSQNLHDFGQLQSEYYQRCISRHSIIKRRSRRCLAYFIGE